jgi:hypothetical protein
VAGDNGQDVGSDEWCWDSCTVLVRKPLDIISV